MPPYEHLFVSAQGSPYARFRRALATRSPTLAFAAAAELETISLEDALALTLLVRDREPARFGRAAAKWAGRWIVETPGVELEEAMLALAALGALGGGRTREAAHVLASLCDGRGQPRLGQELRRWQVERGPGR